MKFFKPEDIHSYVWSMATGHGFTEQEINSLVDALAKGYGSEIQEETSCH